MPFETPLDKPVRDDAGGVPKVGLASFIYTFNEIAGWVRSHPTTTDNISVWEGRLAALGEQVGIRSLGMAALNDTAIRHRDLSTDDITKFVATVLWRRWFDRPASRFGPATAGSVHVIDEDSPVFLPLRPPHVDYSDLHYGAFIAGMIRGILKSCGYPAQVSALYTAGPPNPATQFLIQWEPSVLERERISRN